MTETKTTAMNTQKQNERKQSKVNELFSELKISAFLVLLIAGAINAVGVTMFLAPGGLYDSGISGTAMLLWQLTPESLTLSFFLIVLNIPLFAFGLKKQGLSFTVYSIWAVFVYSLVSYLITDVLPIDVTHGSPIAEYDLILCAIFGGLISGVGSGITIRYGGAIDGMEVLAVIFAKRLGMTVGTFVMMYNVVLYVVIGFIFQSWIAPLYSIITYGVAIKAVDFIVDGLDKAKSAMIVTTKEQEMSQALSEAFGSGITHIASKGFYSNEEKTIIYFVVNRFQVGRMKRLISAIDSKAFVTISEVSDVLGSSLKS